MHVPMLPAAMMVLLLLAGVCCAPVYAEEPAPPPTEQAKPASEHTNRLAKETSPYLLLHAHNPVDWYPWGPDALEKAQQEGKLIFLSIGYSSCYWCHVMERESFMDEEIAAHLNEHYVCIKVDREERPDIDEIYMTALQVYHQLIQSGQGGGWPLSMFLTPDAEPVVGGTYFPPRDRQDLEGFLSVITRVQAAWEKDPDRIRQRGQQLADYVRRSLKGRPSLAATLPGAERLAEVQAGLAEEYDAEHGGFSYSEANPQTPKFPQASNLLFLIDRVRRAKQQGQEDEQAREMLVHTLDRLAAGGIRDHLGGGFHRYSTDRAWKIPHFEKMLYDNAQLVSVYAEAFRLTDNAAYKQVVEETLAFVARELTDSEGGFYSALDAETGAVEGAYYAWDRPEIEQALGAEAFAPFAEAYGLGQEPNFEEHWVLLLEKPLAADASLLLAPAREKLLAIRGQRPRPLLDTKILTSWNGLMIRGYADAGRLLENDAHTKTAARAAEFVLKELRDEQGRLKHTYGQGQAKLNAYLDDYACLIDGLIALQQATGDRHWLDEAGQLMDTQVELFWDDDAGGFFFTSDDHEELIARSKDPVDSATPSGNTVSANNLVYLAQALDNASYREHAQGTILACTAYWEQVPAAMPRMAIALAGLLDQTAPDDSQE